MNLEELTKLDELRTALRAIEAKFQATHAALNLVITKVEDAYYDAFMAAIAPKIPYSMTISIPDAAYREEARKLPPSPPPEG